MHAMKQLMVVHKAAAVCRPECRNDLILMKTCGLRILSYLTNKKALLIIRGGFYLSKVIYRPGF